MSRIIDAGLKDLLAIIYRMGDLAYQAASTAIHDSIHGGSSYNRIREISSMLIMLADQVEDKAFEMIVRFQPVASDLRAIKSFMKISYDLTRFGRYALDISYLNERFGGLKDSEEWIRSYIMNMGNKTLEMMRMSMEALRNSDLGITRRVSEMEKEIDKLYFEFLDRIIQEGGIESRIIISSVLIIRYFERIADHATYLCESIVYMLTGRREFLR